ncbi:DDE-type integrase/transposase/recombinase [Wohlfahrtiimonas chitiniclastica]|nr:DDE-type integrase/transposase/recombinase [Wohlfahrtiimonas chitiniclastica]
MNAKGHTIDFMLSKHRDKRSAKRFFNKAMEKNLSIITANILNFKIRQCKYKNNIIEQDHRFIKK